MIRARYYSVKVHWSLWFFSQQWKISKLQPVKIPDQRSALFFHEAAFFQWWLPLPDTFVTRRHVHSCRREAEHEGILVFSCTCMNPDSKGYCCSQFVPFHMKSVREKKVFTYWVEYGDKQNECSQQITQGVDWHFKTHLNFVNGVWDLVCCGSFIAS